MSAPRLCAALSLAAMLSVAGAGAAPLLVGELEVPEGDEAAVQAYCEGLAAEARADAGEEDTATAAEAPDDAEAAAPGIDAADAEADADPDSGEAGMADHFVEPVATVPDWITEDEGAGDDEGEEEDQDEDENDEPLDLSGVTLEECKSVGLVF